MNPVAFWRLLRQTVHDWIEDKVPRLGAALAYYSVFSLAPLLLLAVGIAGMIYKERARGEIIAEIENTVGASAANAIADVLETVSASGGGSVATWVGLVILLFGASGVFLELQSSLNTIWKVEQRPDLGWMALVRDRLLSFLVVVGTGLLLLASLVAGTAGNWLDAHGAPGAAWAWQGANLVLSFGLVTVLFALLYKILPDAAIAWRDVWVGALVTAVLFTTGKYGISLYLAKSGISSAFGAAGSIVVLLTWVYYSAQIVLFGAEFTRVYAMNLGSRIRPTGRAVAVETVTRPATDPSRTSTTTPS